MSNIWKDPWKDPKVELPKIDSYVACIAMNCLFTGYVTTDDGELCLTQFNGGWLSFSDEVFKWAYDKDLIKQAKGE